MIAQDQQLAQAIQAGQRGPIQARLNQLAGDNGIRRGVMTLQKLGRFETGRGDALAPARTRLLDARGANAGVLTLSAVGAEEYAQLTKRVTGADVVVSSGNDLIASTLPDAGAERLPDQGQVEIGGRGLRVTGFDGPGFTGGRVQVRLLAEPENGGLSGASIEVIAILLAALIAAFAFALTVSRSLQAQIERLLDAARKLARRRLRDRGADRGQRRVRRARHRVQPDGPGAREAARGAAARAQAPARGDPPRRPVVRQGRSSATRCSRSWSRPRSTASAPTSAARRCAPRRRAASRRSRARATSSPTAT